MSKLRIQVSRRDASHSKWANWGLDRAPFPESGVATSVQYDAHLEDQVSDLTSWLQVCVGQSVVQWAPLALKGDIGVGKTHWLHVVEKAIIDFREESGTEDEVLVTNHVLTGAGMRSLTLGALLEEGLIASEIVPKVAVASRGRSLAELNLPSASPIRAPLERMSKAKSDEQAQELGELFRGWLSRRRLTPTKLGQLGVGDRLESEGQWVRAQAHVCRAARAVGVFQVWFVLIDQLEDLWRRDVTTPLRRARFLTDLRTLIDEAYDGAPVPVAMAWNTGGGPSFQRPADVEEQLNRDYHALFSRIHRKVVSIPLLPREHALSFAMAYIDKAARKEPGSSPPQIADRLRRDFPRLTAATFTRRAEVSPRDWLTRLAEWADALPDKPN